MLRKSTAEKKALGTFRPNRDRRTLSFTSRKAIRPPSYLKTNPIALGEWKAVAPYLEAEGILKPTDVSLLASYCTLYARWREAARDVEDRGQTIVVSATTRTGVSQKPTVNPSVRTEILYQAAMMKAAVKFGLNPLDRPRVELSPFDKLERDDAQQEAEDSLDDYGVEEYR